MTERHPAVAFLLAAHQQAEEAARAAVAVSGGEEWTDGGKHGEHVHVKDSNSYVAIGPWGCGLSDGIRMHIALHDPAAVLRRIAAEREQLAEHADEDGDCRTCAGPEWSSDDAEGNRDWSRDAAPWPCRTVLLLAKGWGWEDGSV